MQKMLAFIGPLPSQWPDRNSVNFTRQSKIDGPLGLSSIGIFIPSTTCAATLTSWAALRFVAFRSRLALGTPRGRSGAQGQFAVEISPLNHVVTESWLQVFRSADAARFGHGGSRQLQTRAVRSEKGMALRSGYGMEMCVIAAFFARVLRGYTGRACIGFLSLLQEVRAICKTCNQFTASGSALSDQSSSLLCGMMCI